MSSGSFVNDHQAFIFSLVNKENNHFKVEKDSDGTSTKTYVKRLENEEVAIEIARLMSGEVITSEAILTAKNLMN
jgi:DNA repair ATPase RecN